MFQNDRLRTSVSKLKLKLNGCKIPHCPAMVPSTNAGDKSRWMAARSSMKRQEHVGEHELVLGDLDRLDVGLVIAWLRPNPSVADRFERVRDRALQDAGGWARNRICPNRTSRILLERVVQLDYDQFLYTFPQRATRSFLDHQLCKRLRANAKMHRWPGK